MDARAVTIAAMRPNNVTPREAPRPRRPSHRGGPEGPWWTRR